VADASLVAIARLPSSLEIAQDAELRPITEIAAGLSLEPEEIEQYGRFKAKIDLGVLDRLDGRTDAPLVCVTSITPTRSGEERRPQPSR
jgi:formyltetrahydrofolate synthetase